jgi:hypothetical protein
MLSAVGPELVGQVERLKTMVFGRGLLAGSVSCPRSGWSTEPDDGCVFNVSVSSPLFGWRTGSDEGCLFSASIHLFIASSRQYRPQ